MAGGSRRVLLRVLERPTGARNAFNEPIEGTPVAVGTVYAIRRDRGADDRATAGARVGSVDTVFVVRCNDLTESLAAGSLIETAGGVRWRVSGVAQSSVGGRLDVMAATVAGDGSGATA